MQTVRFVNSQKNNFYPTLKKRVNEYFLNNQKSKNANGLMYFKLVFYVGGMFSFFGLLLFAQFNYSVSLLLWGLTGLFAAFIGVNVCHDAIHGSFSKNKWVSLILSKLFNIIGANDYIWKISHNVAHHTFTNVDGQDSDLNSGILVRLSPTQEWRSFHRFQHIYAFILYSLATLTWVFHKDFKKLSLASIGPTRKEDHPKGILTEMIIFKIIHHCIFTVLPFFLLPFAWWQIVLGFVFMHVIQGYTLALIFMLAHEVEGLDFPMPNEKGEIDADWGVHQMRTTCDFATKSFMAAFLTGGLNFQVEHHLFPAICHVHYPAISKIVEKTAHEFNVPYHYNSTFFGALASHYRQLKHFGQAA